MKRIYFYFIVSTIFFPTLAMSAFGAQKIPQWQREMNERVKEMEALQQQNGTGNEQLVKSDFPATYADLPFLQRIKMESEDISKYKNLKTYKDLDIKTAAQWCGDTKNQTSPECIKYFCSPGGPKANTTGCISWRCDEKAYYKAHKEECETNKLCADGKESSDACMDYRCHKTSDKDSAKCTDWLCQNDPVYNSAHQETCNPPELTTPPEQEDENDSIYKEDVCYTVDDTTIHVGKALTKGVDGDYCEQSYATKTEIDDLVTKWEMICRDGPTLVCKPLQCKEGWLPDSQTGKCVDHYYFLAIFADGGVNLPTSRLHNTQCISICGVSTGGDDVNKKVLNPILGADYCTPDQYLVNWVNKSREKNILKSRLQNVKTGQPIVFTEKDFDKIRDGLKELRDKGECDKNLYDIVAHIYRVDVKTNTPTKVEEILLDD